MEIRKKDFPFTKVMFTPMRQLFSEEMLKKLNGVEIRHGMCHRNAYLTAEVLYRNRVDTVTFYGGFLSNVTPGFEHSFLSVEANGVKYYFDPSQEKFRDVALKGFFEGWYTFSYSFSEIEKIFQKGVALPFCTKPISAEMFVLPIGTVQ